MYKRRKCCGLSKAVMVITVILLLNFMGISYASWNDNLEVNSLVSMGKIDPKFGSRTGMTIDPSRMEASFGEVTFIEKSKESEESQESQESQESFNIEVKNEGTVPIKTDGVTLNKDGITIIIPSHEIEPEASVEITLKITVNEEVKPGVYSFESDKIKILYKQNMANSSWKKELSISGKIIVDEILSEELLPEELLPEELLLEEPSLEEAPLEEAPLEEAPLEEPSQEEPPLENAIPQELEPELGSTESLQNIILPNKAITIDEETKGEVTPRDSESVPEIEIESQLQSDYNQESATVFSSKEESIEGIAEEQNLEGTLK